MAFLISPHNQPDSQATMWTALKKACFELIPFCTSYKWNAGVGPFMHCAITLARILHGSKQRQDLPAKQKIKKKELIMTFQKKFPFVNLTKDVNFKYYFSLDGGSLLSLLKTFLPLPDKKSVQSVEIIPDKELALARQKQRDLAKNQPELYSVEKPELILTDPHLYPPIVGEKHSVLDLNVSLNTGEKIDVEMQANSQKAFSKRSVYYWAQLHSKGLKAGEDYSRLHPTYSLIFTTFPMFEGEERDFVTSFAIRSDEHPHFVLNDQLRMVFVDLSCFEKDISQVLDKKDQWCYFIKNAGRMTGEEKKLLSGKGAEMAKAVGLFDGVPASRLTRLREWSIDRYERDQRSLKDELEAKLKAQLKDELKAEGRKEGMEKGMQQGRQEVALNFLSAGLDLETVSKCTGLSEEKLKKLKTGS